MSAEPRAYVLGHSDHERRRLMLQATMLAPHTMRFLVDAGIGEGMRVLDLGCGVGDVSLLLGHLAGATGSVLGLDMDPVSVEIANSRAAQHQFAKVRFESANVMKFETAEQFDAVVGRLILQHMEDPVGLLRTAVGLTRPGGIIAFQDCTPEFNVPSWPVCPIAERALEVIAKFAVQAIPQFAAGARLYHWFTEAGLDNPQVDSRILAEGGKDSMYYEWLAETLRNVMPRAILLGLCSAEEFNLDTLAADLRAEALFHRAPLHAAILTSVWARRSELVVAPEPAR